MSIVKGLISGNAEYEIAKSLRFRGPANAYVTRSVPVAGNRKTWTWSGWIKRGTIGTLQSFFAAGANASNRMRFYFEANDTFSVFNTISNSNVTLRQTSSVFRDPSAAFHLVVAWDSTQATANDRLKLYVNGQQITSFSTTNNVALNNDGWVNSAAAHYIGATELITVPFDGVLSELNLIDGLALGPEHFGYSDADTNAWKPKAYTGTYGTNGFYLPFNDGTSLATLGQDRSGNGNHWTLTNHSITAGVTYDWLDDTPTNNYCSLNPLNIYNAPTISNANQSITGSSTGYRSTIGTLSIKKPTYFEVTIGGTIGSSRNANFGVASNPNALTYTSFPGADATAWSIGFSTSTFTVSHNNASTSPAGTPAAGTVLGVAVDPEAGKIWFSIDGAWVSGDPAAGTSPSYSNIPSEVWPILQVYQTGPHTANFGQRPFAYTPPAGFKALCTKNLPEPGVVAKNPKKHFDIALNTDGNIKTASEELFPSNFLEWIKDRGAANNHQLIDIVRGTSAVLQSNTTAAETTYVAPSSSSVGWVWKAGGAPVANTAGSISSQVSANVDAGFSIVTYTGNGIDGATVGHGLGVVPKMVIVKAQNNASNWRVFHSSLNASNNLYLNSPNAQDVITTTTGGGIGTSPSSSVFTCVSGAGGNINNSNAATWTYVAYCFTKVPGFSKLGSYTGNGLADGPFVYCGFRPRFLMAKRADTGTENWVIIDTARDVINVAGTALFPNLNNGESVLSPPLDICSNGFKIRAAASGLNTSGATYIFYAIADQTLKYSNAR